MLLKIENLNKTYHVGNTPVQALKDIQLEINSGEFTAIVGPSGSGKTTLLNCIGCIDNAESGKILLDGINVMDNSSKELAKLRKENFGFIFQTYNLIPVLNAFENIELPLKILKRYSDSEIKDKVFEILEKVGLAGLEKRKPLELSGGQQQRISIARALVKNPKIVLADEPTANLDSKTGESIVELMQKINEEQGVTFIFSTHDQLIMKHARRVIELRDGKVNV